MFTLPSEKGPTLKGNDLVPLGREFFPFRVEPFSEGAWHAGKKANEKLQKLSPLLAQLMPWPVIRRPSIVSFSHFHHLLQNNKLDWAEI